MADKLLLEDGFFLLLETGTDKLLLEDGAPPPPADGGQVLMSQACM